MPTWLTTRTVRSTSTSALPPPPARESNWVQTIPGQHWFSYFRFYGPLETYFDRSWKLGDITPAPRHRSGQAGGPGGGTSRAGRSLPRVTRRTDD